jgi:hypothetical protein
MLAILMVAPVLAQSPKSKTHQTITGCLTSTGSSHEYQLVDEKGVTNIVHSTTVHLNSYVGQSVSLVGDQSATPSTDTGTGRPMPRFKVVQLQKVKLVHGGAFAELPHVSQSAGGGSAG